MLTIDCGDIFSDIVHPRPGATSDDRDGGRVIETATYRSFVRAAWERLPLLVILAGSVGTTLLSCGTSKPPQWEMAYTLIFPMFWVSLAAWRGRDVSTTAVLATAAGLALLGIALAGLFRLLPLPDVSAQGSKRLFEFGTIALLLLMAVHCGLSRGRWMFAIFFVGGAIYGLSLENGGVAMGFFRENGYMVYIPPLPAPFFVAMGWCTIFYCSIHLTNRIAAPTAPVAAKAFLTAAVALCVDLHVDPTATHYGWWVWHETLPAFHHGVPLINYISWGCAFLPFAWHYHAMEHRQYTGRRRALLTVLCVPVYLAAAGTLELALTALVRGVSSPDMNLFMKAMTKSAAQLKGLF